MSKIFFKFFIFLFLFTNNSESKNFINILINGNERISNDTILVFSDISNKKFLDENSINSILKRLYETGFFKDVFIKIENENLIIEVVENPIIQSVFVEGIKRKKTEEAIYEFLSLKNRSSFNVNLADLDEKAILRYLKNQGYYFSTVITSTQDLGNNTIDLFFKVDLGKKAKISKISFIGDKQFKVGTLKNVIISEEYKFWKLISGKKFLNEDLINYDKRLLNNFYKNKGFYNVKIESSYANYLGDDKFEIIYNISSGKKYFFNKLNLKLPLDYEVSNFDKLNLLFDKLKGEYYSLNSIDKILSEIDKIVLNEQFEFLNSTVVEDIEGDLINLTFVIVESEKHYVEKINIFGNNITREGVIRNNFLLDEGDGYNELLQTKTINKLKSLNFFSEVSSEVIEGSSANTKIINISVEEKPTGEISAGAGVGTDGGTVAFGISENNFLGRGIEFSSDLSLSQESVKGKISLKNPNYLGTNRSLDLSLQSTITDRLVNFGYKSNKTGFSVGTSFEYYDDLFLTTGVSSFIEKLETDSTASASLKKQEASYFDTFFNYNLNYDKRNQRYKPSDGFISRFSQKIPLISESYTLTNSYDYKFYNEWLNENIATFGFFASTTNSLTGKNVRLSDRIFLPSSKLRGFESGKMGPKDSLDFIGGNYAMTVNISTTLPQVLPNLQNTNFLLFFDAANVWGIDYNSSLSDESTIRSSVGLAVDFFTVVGPLNFSLSQPITKGKNDITETFRFDLGTTF